MSAPIIIAIVLTGIIASVVSGVILLERYNKKKQNQEEEK